ncbi:hypothetical protein CLV49_2044 [Labedella gwakjiensis]|uniref:Uncharacterized protein n=1 Tax=Labedella gwakjiensis TaxID=390269 RepID=A0A2P8GWU1_9MICO|nr:hypothetical protein [Labedella gwakjiensis]PSL38422.1 hypothetical protein CLV49_2044 [Labedella gwakjiensis]RUQ87053.1 hypothetical protein ELQ93_08990 [Labedella gwakjiensis]
MSEDLRETGTDLTTDRMMEPEPNVQRIMWTGTIWFAAVVVSIALSVGMLISSGWRPAVLPEPLQAIWWIGAFAVALSVGLIGWSGCPILEVSVPVASRNKSRTMQFGTFLFIMGGAIAVGVEMLSPAMGSPLAS